MLSAEIAWFTDPRSCSRSSAATTFARAGRGTGFKRCCMLSGRYDGVERDYFFSRMIRLVRGCTLCEAVLVLPRTLGAPHPRCRTWRHYSREGLAFRNLASQQPHSLALA